MRRSGPAWPPPPAPRPWRHRPVRRGGGRGAPGGPDPPAGPPGVQGELETGVADGALRAHGLGLRRLLVGGRVEDLGVEPPASAAVAPREVHLAERSSIDWQRSVFRRPGAIASTLPRRRRYLLIVQHKRCRNPILSRRGAVIGPLEPPSGRRRGRP